MADFTEAELFERWRDRWNGFLDDVATADSPANAENALRDKVIIGNAERKIAGGHEGREILELLQNARDAIWEGEAALGRVHVGIYDEGVLVANTGSRFDLFDSQVEDAVTMIGETGKEGDDDESIGHKGVGLKSILATGDSFEIFTRPERSTDDIFGVRLSRSYLVDSVLNQLGHENGLSGLSDQIADSDLEYMLIDTPRDTPVELSTDLADSIAKLPLFNFPVPLEMDGPSSDAVRSRVRELLTDRPGDGTGEPYRTAVFIRYEDSAWRSRLADIGVRPPSEADGEDRSIEDRPDRIWEYLSAGESADGLQPETLVQLGGIEKLHLERATGPDGATVGTEHWTIRETMSADVTTSGLSHDEVHVRIETDDATEIVHEFDQFEFSEPRDHRTTLLVRKQVDDAAPSFESYPLYLFYPIENTDGADLPFCLHGRFRVETNRKNLSSNNFETNCQVLAEGIDLIELVGRETGSRFNAAEPGPYSEYLPWVLLPPVPESTDVHEPSPGNLIEWFQQKLYARLTETACIPTAIGPRRPDATLLHWESDVIEGYIAYRAILDELDRDTGSIEGRPLPTTEVLQSSRALPESWSPRLKTLIDPDGEGGVSHDVLDGWVRQLESSLSMESGGSPAVSVPAAPARSLLRGTVALLMAASENGESLGDVLADLADEFDGIYLLPCKIRGVDPDERLDLVTVERRLTPTGGEVTQRRVRSVIWDIESSAQEVDRPPTPQQDVNMTVYFLDEAIQADSDTHHVLSLAGRVWGLRAYEGMPSFIRSLLDTFADGRQDIIEPIDFAFLTAIVDRLGEESSDLQTGEGDFFPLEYLRSAIPQQEGDRRANLRRRVQLRTCDLQLHGTEPKPLADTVLGDNWQTIRARNQATEEEDDVAADWTESDLDTSSLSIWPEPDAHTWEAFRDQIKRDVTDLDFVRTLSLLGTGVLPGVRIVWMYGDDHPPMRQDHHWNPNEWSQEDFVDRISDSVALLQATLEKAPDYLSLITSPDYHPQTSASHSSKCPASTDGELSQVNLASWVWIEDPGQYAENGAVLRELLRRHGDALEETLLRTGWSCNRGHKRRAWDKPVPSLLNWQLRELDIWGPVIEVDDELESAWDEQAARLRYAVRIESRRGAQGARMFPFIDAESGFSDRLLSTFGVQPIDEFGVTGATERLQKLQEVLCDGRLPETETKRVWIPGERINDWNQAYTQLLQPVLKSIPENPDEHEETNWGALTHLPLRDGDHWVTASIEWISENADEIRYYPDQSPKPWETQEVEEKGYLILPRTSGGPFRRLAAALRVDQLQASKLVFDLQTDGLDIITDQYSDDVETFQRILTNRRDLLVASTERSDEEEIVSTAEEITTAAANLAVAASFPEDALKQLSDPASALYETEEGDEALILNADEMKGALSLQGLAMGLSLLVERPTKVATFREALRDDVELEELESRWSKRTFPIATVKRVLGSNQLQSLERDMEAVNDLLSRLNFPRTDLEPALAALEDAEPEALENVREWLQRGVKPPAIDDEDISIDPAVEQAVGNLQSTIPAELAFVMDGLFSETVTHWVRELEDHELDRETASMVIEWLADNRAALERPPFDQQARQTYNRFLTVRELWEQTDAEGLADVEIWVDRLSQLHTSTPPSWTDSIPDKFASQFDCPPLVVHVCINNRVRTLVDDLCKEMESELDEVAFDWRAVVKEFVEKGTVPELETDAGAKDHQQRAFSDLATVLSSSDPTGRINTGEIVGPKPGDSVVRASPAGGSAGGSTQYRGRGQQAEVFVMAGVIDRISTWIEDHPAGDVLQFRRQFKQLYQDQQETNYKWHVESVWNSELQPLLEDPARMDRVSITNWRSMIGDERPFDSLPLIQLINVTMERGPGFDVIDPLGPMTATHDQNDFGLWFTPVEIKAVDGSTPPLSFRITTNEYRQARAFVRHGIPYVIRLVEVPEPDTIDWPEATNIVAEEVLETLDELDAVIGNQRLEEIVKGGYMNMRIE